MKTAYIFTFVLLSFCSMYSSANADALADGQTKYKVAPVVPLKVHAFPLQDVRLLDGPFKHAMELDRQYLLSLDVDRLLHNFRVNAGLPSSAKPLGGWEEPKCELRGHFVGHYLTACALMYASTGDEKFKQKGDAVVAGLAECQAKIGTGYLSAYPETILRPVGECPTSLGALLHPAQNLRRAAGYVRLLRQSAGAWMYAKSSPIGLSPATTRLSDEQMQKMLRTEHGGMNEVLANLYAITGEEKYLKIAKRFNHHGRSSIRPRNKRTNLPACTPTRRFRNSSASCANTN